MKNRLKPNREGKHSIERTAVLVRDWRTLDCYSQVQDILLSNSVAVCPVLKCDRWRLKIENLTKAFFGLKYTCF